MKIRLLNDIYIKKTKSNIENLYRSFTNDTEEELIEKNFSENYVIIERAPSFPIYIAKGNQKEKEEKFLKAFNIVTDNYINTSRDVYLNKNFWYSLLIGYKRDFILREYPEVKNDIKKFQNIVLKNFDWENYIYKIVIGSEYISDKFSDFDIRQRYFKLIVENLDLYNYILKYILFRNDNFLINTLKIIEEYNIGKILKSKILGDKKVKKDKRYGRQVLFEFNKSYPIVLSPMMDYEDFKEKFLEYLSIYYDIENIEVLA